MKNPHHTALVTVLLLCSAIVTVSLVNVLTLRAQLAL